jgi:hypothetical protein
MCRPYIDTNNPQGMQLGRFKNRIPARFKYFYCTLFPLCHSHANRKLEKSGVASPCHERLCSKVVDLIVLEIFHNYGIKIWE